MTFTHTVKHNGVYYPAGANVPIETKTSEGVKAPAPLVSGKVDEVKEDVVVKEDKPRKYSEEDLKLPYMKLKALAKKEGFKVESNAKADEIREMLRTL